MKTSLVLFATILTSLIATTTTMAAPPSQLPKSDTVPHDVPGTRVTYVVETKKLPDGTIKTTTKAHIYAPKGSKRIPPEVFKKAAKDARGWEYVEGCLFGYTKSLRAGEDCVGGWEYTEQPTTVSPKKPERL